MNEQQPSAESHKRAFDCWRSMLYRCDNPNAPNFKHYGGRGIKVCARWREFSNFLADMGDPPMGKSIDRYPNRDGDYEPGNCRWATPSRAGRGNEMILTPEQQKSFEEAARPLMKWLNENCHPHVNALVDCTSAELSEGVCSTGRILDYVKD